MRKLVAILAASLLAACSSSDDGSGSVPVAACSDEGQKQFFVYDLATSNGTIVNGKKIVKEALYDGDEVEVGRTVLVFKQIDGPTREGESAPSEEEAGEQEGE